MPWVALEPKRPHPAKPWWKGTVAKAGEHLYVKDVCHRRPHPEIRRNGASYGHGTHFSKEAARACAEKTARRLNKEEADGTTRL